MSKVTINDIVIRVQAAAKEKNIKLTYSGVGVYLKLIEYAKEHKELVVDYKTELRYSATVQTLSKYCKTSPHKITDTLNKLNDCGVIRYTINTPNPSVITLFKQYYE